MYIGSNKAAFEAGEVKGEAVVIGDENYYKICLKFQIMSNFIKYLIAIK